jgi:flagellar capping protein FliD
MPDGEHAPTLGEVTRRLDDVSRRLDSITKRMEESQTRFEATFVPRAVYEADKRTDDVQIKGLESEVHSVRHQVAAEVKRTDERFEALEARLRRWATLGFTVFLGPLVVGLALVWANGGIQ